MKGKGLGKMSMFVHCTRVPGVQKALQIASTWFMNTPRILELETIKARTANSFQNEIDQFESIPEYFLR